MDFSTVRRRPRWAITGALVAALVAVAASTALGVIGGGDDATYKAGTEIKIPSEFGAAPLKEAGSSQELLQRNAFFMSRRTAGTDPLDNEQAGAERAQAAFATTSFKSAKQKCAPNCPFTAPWGGIGPNPIVQGLRSPGPSQRFGAMSGRIGALAVRDDGTILLAGAQGGIWKWAGDTGTGAGTWTPLTDNAVSLAMGSLAVAPSNDNIVYGGTGEGHLSGDSYFGNGILKSTDGGTTWAHVSGDFFRGVAVSRLVVHPTDPNLLYAAVLRGRGGSRRVTPAVHSRYGIWRSTNGGVSWTLLREATEATGATDVELDPQDPGAPGNPATLYASFWGDAMYKSTDGGATWNPIMNGILGTPAQHASNLTRFSIAVSRPSPASEAVLYAGFDWVDGTGYHPSRVWKSINAGASWTLLPAGAAPPSTDNVQDYCGGQCFYDNVIEAAPDDPDVVYAGGQFNYSVGSGGFFRSDDGGQTWIDLGYDQHPDFQAFAFDPNNSNQIVHGSDGGVWYSANRGGRTGGTSDPLDGENWVNLNGTVNPANAAVTARSELQLAQFTSIATVPTVPGRFWGGTQDNGTLRRSTASDSWFDLPNGDGGQVLVDPTLDGACEFGAFSGSCFVYGTYFGISPYRMADGGAFFFNNNSITNGINLSDRSTFYIPMAMNKDNPSQLFLGTYRLYRTNNARTPAAGDVRWNAISPDLTSGCTGTAPNGARGCFVSAIGVGGGDAVYTGSEDGHVFVSPNAQTSNEPDWVRIDEQPRRDDDDDDGDDDDDDDGGDDDWSWSRGRSLPDRPVTQIAVDRSNYRTAYVSLAGFNPATPGRPGHLFKTTDAGKRWENISGNLPDLPVNSVILDPSYPDTLYVGTDIGVFVTHNGGKGWAKLGTGFPNVATWQLDMNPSDVKRVLVAGTHGRGAFRLDDQSAQIPALVVSKVDAAVPVGPGSRVDYTLTLRNFGNADATGVTIIDPVPDNTSFVSADSGGTYRRGKVRWSGLTVPKASVAAPGVAPGVPGTIQVRFSVNIAQALKKKVMRITNDGIEVTSAQGTGATGSPFITPIAPPHAVLLAPASQTDGGRVGTNVDYKVTLSNVGFNADSYTLSSTGGTWTTTFLDSTCTTPLAGNTTANVPLGGSTEVCVRVAVPGASADGATNDTTVTATSVGDPAVSASGAISTIAVAVNALLVDNDTNAPIDSLPIYRAALDSAGVTYQDWDLNADGELPLGYLKSFSRVVWFTGNSWPQPLAPNEAKLIAYLDEAGASNGLFMAGQDILDQSGGTTVFASDYLHVDWDGTETQNDKNTDNVISIGGTITEGIGTVPLPGTVLGADFENRITPIAPAVPIFTDETPGPDNKRGLSFDGGAGSYQVVFLPFAFEAYGSAAQKQELVQRVMTFLGP